ncbi:MAG: O-antigen ligase family protein [Candidatus Dojkabacteria bacterium]|nr:O-antigen ligase family protein [Candidatus Dojkabacteria bacterium]
MKISQVFKKYWNIVISVGLVIPLIAIASENFTKAIIILIIIVIWNILGILFRNFLKASFLCLLIFLPFNITYQLQIGNLGPSLMDSFVNGITVNYLIPTLSIVDLLVFLLLSSLIFTNSINLKKRGFSFENIFILFAVFLILQNFFMGISLTVFNSIRLLLYIFTFYSLKKNIKDILSNRILSIILIISILSVLFQGVIALLQFSGGSSVGLSFLGESNVVNGMIGSSFLELNNALYLRGYGTFPHPNVLGGWLIFNMLLGWYLFDSMKRKRDYSILLMVVSSLVLVLTFSRISWLVCGIIWLAFIIKTFISKRGRIFTLIPLLSERVLNLFNGGDTSWSDRLNLMKSSFYIIKNNFLFGVGLGNFTNNMDDTVPITSNGILLLQPVHNIFLLMFSELGLIGSGFFCTLLYFFLKNREWNLRFILSLVSIFIIGMFDHYMFSLPQGLGLFFLMITL